jgi:glucuronate isomerase
MTGYLNGDFFLQTETARRLYHSHAAQMPIADFHCHIDPKEIALGRRFDNLTQLWLNADHYKWRLMRQNGVPESHITGNAPDYEKFLALAQTMPKAAGNPVHHWAHLELRRYFGCTLDINEENAPAIWQTAGDQLPGMSAREIIRRSGVKVIATTDCPSDSLEWHSMLRADPSFGVKVVPTFRPGNDLLETPDKAYLTQCAEHFNSLGCRASDHSMSAVPQAEDAGIFLFLGALYKRLGWVMQLRFGVRRNVNSRAFAALGPDTGFDCIGAPGGANLASFLDLLHSNGSLPKTIIYSLDPNDNTMIGSVCQCFENVLHGPAWWFNDSKSGIESHLTTLAETSLLGSCLGMVTDSRSFLSYTRHEYFRRILCNLLGGWAERGAVPDCPEALGKLVRDISYNNAMRYFGF